VSSPRVTLEPIRDREALIPLLLEADESEEVVRGYLFDGDLYRVLADGEQIGAVLLLADGDAVEIKNIVLSAPFRGRGLGRATIEAVVTLARRSGATRLLVGTAETSADTIEFYRRVGFRDAGRIEGFFDAYPEPVIEEGVVAHDMVRFRMDL
jgi:GNAT superfamily N-acetyltransferase